MLLGHLNMSVRAVCVCACACSTWWWWRWWWWWWLTTWEPCISGGLMGGLYWSGCPIRGGYLPSPVNTQTRTLSKLASKYTSIYLDIYQNVPKITSYELVGLDSLALAHLGLERKGGKTGAWWERGRGQVEDPSDWQDVWEQEIALERGRGLAAAADYSGKREREERSCMLRHVRMTSCGICLYLRDVQWGKIAGFVVAVWFPVWWRWGSRLLTGRNAQLHHHHSTRRRWRRHSWKSHHRHAKHARDFSTYLICKCLYWKCEDYNAY